MASCRRSQNGPVSLTPTTTSYSPTNKNEKPQPITFSQLLRLLEIQDPTSGGAISCHGLTKEGANCQAWVGKSLLDEITSILQNLVKDWHKSSNVLNLLDTLSKLVLCRGFHQRQASTKLRGWKSKLPSAIIVPEDSLIEDAEVEICVNVCSEKNVSRSNFTTLPTTSFDNVSRTRRAQNNTPQPIRIHLQQTSSSSSSNLSQRTRSKTTLTKTTPTPTPTPTPTSTFTSTHPSFEPYNLRTPHQSQPSIALKNITTKLLAPITANEQKAGWIYGFRRPNSPFIKIGTTTKTPEQRLETIGMACGYVPLLVFKYEISHAMKVEKLIHLHLHAQRRRENLLNGRCNEGKGCASRHQEWFEIPLHHAKSVVERWVEWMRVTIPYDIDGRLHKDWAGRVKTLRSMDLVIDEDGGGWTKWMASEANAIPSPTVQSPASRKVVRGIKQERILLPVIIETPKSSTAPNLQPTKVDPDVNIKTDKIKITSGLARRRVVRGVKREEASTTFLPKPNPSIVPPFIKTEDTCPVVVCY